MASESASGKRKIEELKSLRKRADEEGNVIKSPFYNDVTSNPCIKEQNLSARCSLENHANREICMDYMENYSLCVKFWELVKARRLLNSEYPLLPPPDEREVIRKTYIDEYKKTAMDIAARSRRGMYGKKRTVDS